MAKRGIRRTKENLSNDKNGFKDSSSSESLFKKIANKLKFGDTIDNEEDIINRDDDVYDDVYDDIIDSEDEALYDYVKDLFDKTFKLNKHKLK